MAQRKNTKKLTDEAFSRLMFTAVAGILLCIFCLCSTTYAWFTASIPSTGNEVKTAGECLLSVTVSRDGVALDGVKDGVELEASPNGEDAITYDVVLALPPDTASGYCVITAGDAVYYTEYIARHYDAEPKTVSFTITVGTTQTVTFTPRWGIYAEAEQIASGEFFLP